jgi:4-hydroxy-tetrahydrodipicolinate reductase
VTRLAICGIRGRMGQALARLIGESPDLELVSGIDREPLEGAASLEYGCPVILSPSEAIRALEDVDVLVDFSAPAATRTLLESVGAALDGRGLVVGTTGLEAETELLLSELAWRAAVLTAANFSIGVNLLVALAERAAAVLDAGRYDVEIVESHHNRKADAPSGTALMLGEALARGRGRSLDEVRTDGRSGRTGERPVGEIGFHALRAGGIVGEHSVQFVGARERIELAHQALDRDLFADGALTAARWIAGRRPGRYGMAEVLGLEGATGG